MKLAKRVARSIIFPTIVGTGMERLLSKFSSKHLLNIYYHGVVKHDSNFFNPRHLTIEQFEQQIKYFSKYFDIISLADAFDVKKGKLILSKPTITISFDDGYKNNISNALPILEKYNVKATFFVSGICAINNPNTLLWADIIDFVKYFNKDEKITVEGNSFINYYESESKLSIYDFIKNQSKSDRDQILSSLMKLYNIDERKHELDPDIWQLMNSNDIIQASQNKLISIESHGFNHYNLGQINFNDAINDIKSSKEELDRLVPKPVSMICFPDGSYSNEIIQEIKSIGFNGNVACDYLNQEDASNSSIINRYGISNTTTFSSNIFFINKSFINKGI